MNDAIGRFRLHNLSFRFHCPCTPCDCNWGPPPPRTPSLAPPPSLRRPTPSPRHLSSLCVALLRRAKISLDLDLPDRMQPLSSSRTKEAKSCTLDISPTSPAHTKEESGHGTHRAGK